MLLRPGLLISGRRALSDSRNTDPLSTVIASAVFDLDATIKASYDPAVDARRFKNLIASPADGELQTAYTQLLGGSLTPTTNDPEFVGTAGTIDAHFTVADTGDFFELETGVNTTLLANLHQAASTQDFWFACAFEYPVAAPANRFLATRTSADGYLLYTNGSSSPEMNQLQANSGGNTFLDSGSAWLTPGADNLIIVSYDASTDTAKFYINGEAAVTDTGAPPTGTDAAQIALRLLSLSSGTTKYRHFSMGNEYINDTKKEAIRDLLKLRHERTY